MRLPSVAGRWEYVGVALNPDTSVLYIWEAMVEIVEAGDSVTVALENAKSRSISRSATLTLVDDGRVVLLYDFVSDPAHAATAEHYFFGMTRLVFTADGKSAEGHYFNYNGRYSFGKARLQRL